MNDFVYFTFVGVGLAFLGVLALVVALAILYACVLIFLMIFHKDFRADRDLIIYRIVTSILYGFSGLIMIFVFYHIGKAFCR